MQGAGGKSLGGRGMDTEMQRGGGAGVGGGRRGRGRVEERGGRREEGGGRRKEEGGREWGVAVEMT